jgi:hypothetical protein
MMGFGVDAWLSATRALFPLLALAFLVLVWRVRSAGLLLAGVLAANAWVWGVTNAPLQRLYGLGPSGDRLNNVGLCQVVVAEGRPLETIQAGQLHFEPFWGLLVKLVAGGDPARAERMYPFFALVVVLAFVLSLWIGLRGMRSGEDAAWERAVVAGFATLLSSAPLDYLGTYRVTWATMFLLKPNHSLGLVLFPLLLLAFARMRTLWQRVLVGLLLQVLGWVFVIHMGFVVLGLGMFALRSWIRHAPERRRDLVDTLIVVGVNLLIVSPYLFMLVVGYPFLKPTAYHSLLAFSPHLLEGTLYAGWLFPLGVWGYVVLQRRGDRLARLWTTQALTALLLWAGYLVLGWLHLARETDEIFQWLRFLTVILAGFGAWDLSARVAAWWRAGHAKGLDLRPDSMATLRAVGLAAAVLPLALPCWWDPPRMDPFFTPSLEPLRQSIAAPAEWLRAHSRPGDVVAGDHDYGNWVSALAYRRVSLAGRFHMPPRYEERLELEHGLMTGQDPQRVHALAARHHVRFLTVSAPLLAQHSVSLDSLKQRTDLHLGYEAMVPTVGYEPVAIFELATPPTP